jgi:hypothetical protein
MEFEGGPGNPGSDPRRVVLRPMEEFRSAQALSVDIGETVREAKNATYCRRWIGVDEGSDAGVIVKNGVGGAGVDIFFSLPIEHMDATKPETYMVFLDQRKRVATDTLPALSTAKSLITKARAAYSRQAHSYSGRVV